ncbi:envelope integrity protein Cei [Pseudonocardia endophytica]|uniref:envelope integrity protein Cei n=1 Tax=Pseudonocardia endophytica TaxID=401976 RepID=UPI001FB3F6DA|nr:envelope integrity protein Cei [Pseudonocardia endophytica]
MRLPESPFPTRQRPYQRRRTRPIVITSIVLAVLMVVIWVPVIIVSSGGPSDISCSPPSQGPEIGTVVDRSEFQDVTPTAPRDVRFTVLNAGDQRGQANLVSAQLGDLEFSEARPPLNDSRYPQGDLDCVGQLRFGPTGEGAASTLALVLPCVELVRDNRPGANVDVVIGASFTDVSPGRAARDVLDQLSQPAGANGRPAVADPNLLAQARESGC